MLVSHLHADHLHLTSLPLVAPGAALVVPRGAARLIQQSCGTALADRCIEVAPGSQVRIGHLDITAVTAAHAALASAASSRSTSFIVEPDRVRSRLPSLPRISPYATCSASTSSGRKPALRATAKS